MDVETLRKDFPVLEKRVYGRPIVYLDSACMTLKPNQVIDAMNNYYTELSSCGGRSVHKLGTEVTIKCDSARDKIQRFFNAKIPEEIIFGKNTTEAINLVARCLDFKKGDVVLTTDREHNSNMAPWHLMRELKGIKHEVVFSNNDNTFNMEAFEERMGSDVKLVSMVHTSNLEGYTIPAQEVIKVAHDHGALVMLDSSQSAAHIPVDVQALDVDFLACSLHKMCGPTGMGVLFGKYDLLEKMSPFIVGGDTVVQTSYESTEFLDPPKRYEAGLQNYAGIIGSGAAVDYLSNIGLQNIHEHEVRLNEMITSGLKELSNLHILGPAEPAMRGGIFGFWVVDFDSHDIAMILDEVANIMIRSGMICVHSWYRAHKINGSARASVYFYNTEEEARFFVDTLKDVIGKMS